MKEINSSLNYILQEAESYAMMQRLTTEIFRLAKKYKLKLTNVFGSKCVTGREDRIQRFNADLKDFVENKWERRKDVSERNI